MKRGVVAILAAISLLCHSAACAHAQAAEPFPRFLIEPSPARSHVWAYVSFAAGAGMIAGSFAIARHANHIYDEYLIATDPAEIERLYNRTQRADRLSSVALLGGEVLIATGIYLRFLRKAPAPTVHLAVTPMRCALAWRF